MADRAPGAGSDYSHNVVQMLTGCRGAPERERVKRTKERRLRIAMLAPLWIPVPPPGYGGIEPAARAGIFAGDVITTIDGQAIRSRSTSQKHAPGSTPE